ncbi:MAG: CPBP family intramembrane metalloprotease [Atopobiaceae bacterium]|nr:CPBP family intramembrane metalloprotease [Atopobiaceae bacterium]
MEKRRPLIYVLVAYGLAWAYWLLVSFPLFREQGGYTAAVQLSVAPGMLFPAIAVVLTRLFTREGFKGLWIVPRDPGRTWHLYVVAWVVPLALVIAGAALYFLLNRADYDPSMTNVLETARQAAEAAGRDPSAVTTSTNLLAMLPVVLFVAPIANFIPCFGEEWGWRGYLLPKLVECLPTLPALVASGVIWGLWHAPIIAMGHNYGVGYAGFPVTGILAMCLFCVILGTFMAYVTLRSGSCIPAVIAHGMINGCAAMGVAYSATGGNPFVGPAPTGILGGAYFVLVALFMAFDLARNGWPTFGAKAGGDDQAA